MKILVINAGSSSLKCSLFTLDSGNPALSLPAEWNAQIDWKEAGVANLNVRNALTGSHYSKRITSADHKLAIERTLLSLSDGEAAALSDLSQIDVVGHRVVHGGTKYSSSVFVTELVLNDLQELVELAPSHERENIRGMEIAKKVFSDAAQVVVFDTAFHNAMPETSKIYAGPYEWYQKLDIKRYGFHGISHEYCARRVAELVGSKPKPLRIVTCHLGSGVSLCAIHDQKCLMTTMGFTPLEGVVMRTRSGSIDPGLILHLLKRNVYSVEGLMRVLSHESGLKGISGLSGDMQEIEQAASQGNLRARLAFDVFIQSLTSHIAALLPILGGLDVLVFTGGIGENSAKVRAAACKRLAFAGIHIDHGKNQCCRGDTDISAPGAPVRTLVVRSKEDLAIAIECFKLMECKSK